MLYLIHSKGKATTKVERYKSMMTTEEMVMYDMMVELGVKLHFAKGSDKNIKLTTKDDLELFKGYLTKGQDKWIK